MPASKRPGWTKRNIRVRDETFEQFESKRKAMRLTQTAALDQALRTWCQRLAADGPEAELVAPTLEQLLQRQISFLEDRLVKLMVKNGVLSSTAVELFLEQRRRNGIDTTTLMREIKDRVLRRWKEPRSFADTDPDATTWGRDEAGEAK